MFNGLGWGLVLALFWNGSHLPTDNFFFQDLLSLRTSCVNVQYASFY
jgi:hypothetical protein